jgi:hypothetical protein
MDEARVVLSPYYSERDIEVPQLLNFVDAHSKEITTILDVGYYGSQYLKILKEKGKIIDGIDLKLGEGEREFLRNYFVGNAVTYPLGQYDLVICLSTIEHAGIKQYKMDDFVKEQNCLFKKVVDASKRFIYVTFPYGDSAFLEGEFVNMTRNSLYGFLSAIPKAVCKTSFYFNDRVYAVSGWTEISQDDADKIQYDPAKGGRCVCILEAIK